MFYRFIIVIGIVLVTTPCFASASHRFVQVMSTEIRRAQLPYVQKIAADTLNAEQLKKFDTIIGIFEHLNIPLAVYREMEAIKLQANGEASKLNIFAVKIFVALSKNVRNRDISYSPYFKLVDENKHLLAKKYIEEIDELAAAMREISSKDFFVNEIKAADLLAHQQLEDRYVGYVFTGLKEAGAIDLQGIVSTNFEQILKEIAEKIVFDSTYLTSNIELVYPLLTINQLKILREQDLGPLGETNFQNAAQSDFGFTHQEINNLQHILDLHSKSEHLVLDYFADNIKQADFVDKIDNLLAKHGEVLSDASKHEISKQLAELR